MANTTGGGAKAVKHEAEDDLASILKELRSDLTLLKTDMETLKTDGVGFGRAAVDAAKERAETTMSDMRTRTQNTVRTVEEDLAEVVSDLTETVQRNPYTALGVAVLSGMLLTSLFRRD